MAKDKHQPQGGPELAEYITTAEPKAYADGVPVFCAHDAIVPIKDLQPNPKNPNQHPPEQIKLLASVIRATGWRGPITVSTRSGYIVKGHGRLMAAELDDLKEVPVDYQNYASEAEEMADLTADNRIAELAAIDNKMLAEVFADIDTGEIPFMLSGYTEEEYGNIVTALSEALHTQEPKGDPDEVIKPPTEPVTKRGDLWILGRHRVVCGDCTSEKDRALLLDGATPEILITDPPYCSGGFQESGRSAGSIGTDRKDGNLPKIANDTLSTRGYQALMKAMLQDLPVLVAYIFTDWRMWVYLFDIVESSGLGVKNMIVWNKKEPGHGRRLENAARAHNVRPQDKAEVRQPQGLRQRHRVQPHRQRAPPDTEADRDHRDAAGQHPMGPRGRRLLRRVRHYSGSLRGIRPTVLHHGADASLYGRYRQEVHQNNRQHKRPLRPSRQGAPAGGHRRDLRARRRRR